MVTEPQSEQRRERMPVAGRAQRCTDAAQAILGRILAGYRGPVAVCLWDGQRVAGGEDARCTVVFRHAGALRELVRHGSLMRLAEAYLRGAVDVEGDVEALFDLLGFLESVHLPRTTRLRLAYRASRLPPLRVRRAGGAIRAERWRRENSPDTIAHHYDVGNEFYALWLDPERVYSCAYFRDAEQSLADAQRDKLDYICRKLRLQPGQTLLDIGCGWGALARWAARHYGARVYGITLSREQYRYACERVREDGLEGRVWIELRDYRDLPSEPAYDRVVSVGMFEHVGVKNFPVYFGTVKRVLKPGGLFLNHGITSETGWDSSVNTEFINRYVFPDAELARIGEVIAAMERAGFEIVDVESLRRHYTLTLRRWIQALEAHRDAAIRIAGEPTYRLWRLYMAGSAYAFEQGSSNVYQVLAGHAHDTPPVPLRRDDLYRS